MTEPRPLFIKRHTISIHAESTELVLHRESKLVCAAMANHNDIYLWEEFELQAPEAVAPFAAYETGSMIPADSLYVATAHNGPYAYHVYCIG